MVEDLEGAPEAVHVLVADHALGSALDALLDPHPGGLGAVGGLEQGGHGDELEAGHGLAEQVLSDPVASGDHAGAILEGVAVGGEPGGVGEHAGPFVAGQGDPAVGGAAVAYVAIVAVGLGGVQGAVLDGGAGVAGGGGQEEGAGGEQLLQHVLIVGDDASDGVLELLQQCGLVAIVAVLQVPVGVVDAVDVGASIVGRRGLRAVLEDDGEVLHLEELGEEAVDAAREPLFGAALEAPFVAPVEVAVGAQWVDAAYVLTQQGTGDQRVLEGAVGGGGLQVGHGALDGLGVAAVRAQAPAEHPLAAEGPVGEHVADEAGVLPVGEPGAAIGVEGAVAELALEQGAGGEPGGAGDVGERLLAGPALGGLEVQGLEGEGAEPGELVAGGGAVVGAPFQEGRQVGVDACRVGGAVVEHASQVGVGLGLVLSAVAAVFWVLGRPAPPPRSGRRSGTGRGWPSPCRRFAGRC